MIVVWNGTAEREEAERHRRQPDAAPHPRNITADVVADLARHPASTIAEIARRTGILSHDVHGSISALRTQGRAAKAERLGRTPRGRPMQSYRLTGLTGDRS